MTRVESSWTPEGASRKRALAAARAIGSGRVAVGLVVAASALLASAFVFGTTPDDEEFRFAVLTSWLHVRALASGSAGFWTSLLGFGVPQPFIPNFWFHPLLPLLAVLSPATWVRLLLLAHTAVGAAGMWHVCRVRGCRPLVRGICACTFLLATPAQNYVLTDLWPSHWIVWTSMPWLMLCLWRVLKSDRRSQWTWSALLGLGAGLVVANTNPGHIVVYAVLPPAIVLGQWPRVKGRWPALLVAALIALAIAAPNAALLANERDLFAPHLVLANLAAPLPVSSSVDVFLRPLSRSDLPWQSEVVARGARNLFFGGPFAVLCLIACLRGGWGHRDLVLGVAASALLLFTTIGPATLASGRYQFRDPLILCAIPLAGLATERGLQVARTRALTTLLLVLQLAVVVAAADPFLARAWNAEAQGAHWFRGATADTPAMDGLLEALGAPDRLLYSPRVDRQVMDRTLLPSGLGVNALAYRGVPVVNGWFKGVSADPIWPDERLFYARIATPRALVESGAALDVLGIRYVLAERSETVAADLHERTTVKTLLGELVLYENDDVWPGAFMLDRDARQIGASSVATCGNDRLLCRDLSTIAQARRSGRVAVAKSDGEIEITVDPMDVPRTLVVTEMFRSAWVASSGGNRLPTSAFLETLLAVDVPPGTTSVQLAYRPRLAFWATVVAWFAIAGAVLFAAVCHAKATRRSRVREGGACHAEATRESHRREGGLR